MEAAQTEAEQKQYRRMLLIEMAVVLGLYFLPAIASAVLGSLVWPQPRSYFVRLSDYALWSGAIRNFCLVPIILFVLWSNGENMLRFGLGAGRWVGLPLVLAGSVVSRMLSASIAVISYGGMLPNWASMAFLLNGHVVALTFAHFVSLLAYFAASELMQELVFRGYLIRRLRDLNLTWWQSVLISTALFSSIHLYQDWYGILSSFLFGLLMAVLLRLSRSIWPGFFVHLFTNLSIDLLRFGGYVGGLGY